MTAGARLPACEEVERDFGSDRVARLHDAWTILVDGLEAWRCDDLSVTISRDGQPVSAVRLDIVGIVVGTAREHLGDVNGYIVPGTSLQDSWLVLNHISLQPAARGRNFARRLFAQLETLLRRIGLRRMMVHAFRTGAYLWAGCGFRFDGSSGDDVAAARQVIERAASNGVLDRLRTDPELVAPLDELLSRACAAGASTPGGLVPLSAPGHFLTFIRNGRTGTPLARHTIVRHILAGSEWRGIKEL